MEEKPEQPRWRIIIYGLLVAIAIFLGVLSWVSYEASIVYERRFLRDLIVANGGRVLKWEKGREKPAEMTRVRGRLGFEPATYVAIPVTFSEDTIQRIRRAYPESGVGVQIIGRRIH